MNETNSYAFDITHKQHVAELQDIAAMDRLAAQLRPESALHRWARERRESARPRLTERLLDGLDAALRHTARRPAHRSAH